MTQSNWRTVESQNPTVKLDDHPIQVDDRLVVTGGSSNDLRPRDLARDVVGGSRGRTGRELDIWSM